ncbi:MAG TPA: hypothetical protein VN132_03965 [Bdellovibrio sp.]|nr:hypothetical protein [Bdellovibrio sp.]
MSEDILEKQPETAATDAAENSKDSSRPSVFGNLNSDLQKALNTWETLTEQMAHKLSPEEEQLVEVKKILGELKAKLSEFGD